MKKVLTEDYEPGVGFSYEKGTVGEVMDDRWGVPWENKNPTLLIFDNDLRDAFPDKVLADIDDDTPLSSPTHSYGVTRKGIEQKNVVSLLKLERMYKIFRFLYTNDDWHSTPTLFEVADVPKTYLQIITSKSHGGTSLESLGLIEMDPESERPMYWRLTHKGREEGYDILGHLTVIPGRLWVNRRGNMVYLVYNRETGVYVPGVWSTLDEIVFDLGFVFDEVPDGIYFVESVELEQSMPLELLVKDRKDGE